MTKMEPPTPEDFLAECTAYLSARYSTKRRQRRSFTWGEGSDRVAVFEEADPAAERAHVAAVRTWRRDLFDNGLGWISGPPALGGRGLPLSYQRAFDRTARMFDTPGNGPLTVSLGMVAPTVLAHGTDDMQRRYSAALQRADLIACQLFSEPGAGSDLASITTTAVRDGDSWRVSGQKVWTSGAHFADIGEIICRTSGDGRHRNLTAFIVDMHAPGVEVRPLRQMTGGASFNEVFFDDVVIPDQDRLGEVGEGWKVALTTLSNERNAIGGEAFGGLGLLDFDRFKAMAAHLGLNDDPIARQRIADLFVHLRVARMTRQRASALQAAGHRPGPEASIGKLALAGNLVRLSELVSSLLGTRLVADSGEWGTYAWTNVVLGVPGYRIGGGTDEILRNVLAERVLGLPKEPAPAPSAGWS